MITALTKWKLALYMAAIFAAGTISGWVLATRTARQKAFTSPRREDVADGLRTCMRSKLNLTPEQKQQVDAIIDRSSKEVWALHEENMRHIKQVVIARNQQLSAVLTPEQQRQFDQIEKERRESGRARDSLRGTNLWHGGRSHWGDRTRRERSPTNGLLVTNWAPDGLRSR
jgi:Spy/CpxP family protein refolding chaperone